MKICWDNLENIKLTVHGNFTNSCGSIFVYKNACKNCGDSYLMSKHTPTYFCSHSCAVVGKSNPMYGKTGKHCPNYGRKHSIEAKKKMSITHTGKKLRESTKLKVAKASKGRKLDFKARQKISKSKIGKKRSLSTVKKMVASSAKGEESRLWKGGVRKLKIPLYDTYSHQIDFAEKTKLCVDKNNLELLEVKCTYCDKWFVPKLNAVQHRISSLNGQHAGESRFYCSDECKRNCPTFNKSKYPKGFKKGTSREVSTYLRKLCFERDDWECQKCGAITNLHCHHINGYAQNKILANDIDNVITLCKNCHKEIHSKIGCRYTDLRCKPIKNKKE